MAASANSPQFPQAQDSPFYPHKDEKVTQIYGHAQTSGHAIEAEPMVKLNLAASMMISSGRQFNTIAHEISVSGFTAFAPDRLHPGQTCWLTFPNFEPLAAEVVWWDAHIVGCTFDNILPKILFEKLLQPLANNLFLDDLPRATG